jgi:ELWxxDGT repeat protein
MKLAAVESAVSTFSLAAVDKTGDVNLVEYGTKITALTSDQRIIKSIGSSNDQTKSMKFAKGIVFEVDSEQAGKELWAINYATGKIDLLEDLNSTSADDADPIVLGLLGDSNKVIFSADSGTSTGSAGVTDTGTGRELWVSAGVAGDPTLVKDIADGSDDGVGVVSNQMVAH